MRSLLCFSPRRSLVSLSIPLILLAGCGGGEGIVLPGEGEPAAIAVVKGNAQRGRVGEPLADPLVVQVTDTRGRPVRGATVAFDFASAGAGAAVVPEEKTTNGDGLADARLVLGTSRGQQTGQARVVVPEGRPPIQAPFSAMALPENANSMTAVAGQDQTGHVGRPLDDRLVVEVTDGFGNPVAGVPISWAVAGGGGVSETLVETDEDGRSRVERVLGPVVGQQTTLASSEGLVGSPVTFTHTALSGDASRLVIVSGSDQTGEAGSTLPEELVVRLIDADGNGVPGTALSWVVAIGGGSATPEISTTDGDGRTSTRWTLGATLGPQRIDAVVSGVGVASFQATATAGAPASLFIRIQPSGSAQNGIPLARQPEIQLRDSRGNEVAQAGVLVTVALGSGGGELGGARQVSTNGAGRAAFTDLSISGAPGPRTLVFTAPGYAQVTSDQIELGAIGTSTTITGDSPDPSGVGTAFTVSFQVSSQGPTPTGSVTVSDGVQSCNGVLSSGAGSCQLALVTVGPRTLTASYSGGPGLLGSSDTEPHTVTAVAPPPPSPTATTITADDPDPSVSGSTVTVSFQVTSSGGTPTGTVRVTVSNGSPSCTDDLSGGSGSCQLTLNTVGERLFTATYSGGPGFSPSSGTASHTVTPPNERPDADFRWHCEGLTCFFTDRSEDDDGDETITGRSWNFGDGSPASNELNPAHAYANPGDYRVVLTVTDNGGLTDEAEDVVDPRAPPPQELAVDRQPSSSATVGEAFDRQPRIELRAGGDDIERAGVVVTATANGGGTLGGTTTATTDEDGQAEFSDLSIHGAAGPHTLSFSAEGFAPVTSNTIDVQKASTTTTITADTPDPSNPGEAITVSFTVTSPSGTPDGTVLVTEENGGSCSPAPTVASGSCTLTPGGTGTITATYQGSSTFDVSSDTEQHTVTTPPANTQTTITSISPEPSVFGGPVDVVFTVSSLSGSGSPTGNVQVTDEGALVCSASVALGTCNGIPPASGSRTFTATYQGDPSFAGSVGTATHTVNEALPGVLGFRTQPPGQTRSGRRLQPEPHVELRDAAGTAVALSGVTISAALASGSATLGGEISRATDGNGRARFDELRVNGSEGDVVTLAFTAPGFAQVDSQPIQIEADDDDDDD